VLAQNSTKAYKVALEVGGMRFLALVVALLIAGCGWATSYQIANMSPDELTKLSDRDICRPWTANNPAVLAERQKRDLGNCDPAQLYCKNAGYEKGTELYLQISNACKCKRSRRRLDKQATQQ
jgi:hypothetical protein